ncbi:maleylpyruvate isomerase family mycothiol-dependent enzyme [Actinomarinicola tropica]|uniref:maleylpyruvate isomerase family mycothiol-dependent enzyme n=1 Tax=Actinomarinicola tropica TaxID=2789776 RepID=UPI0018972D54|nr:maleylpyruvate isomerase family mycothiol-dependent enzyme [Actinomarinicola tropica]
MDVEGWIEALRRDGDALVAVVPADLDVPTCPGWTLVDLYHHLGSVHRWQIAQVATTDPEALQPPPKVELPQDPDDLVDWMIDGVDELADLLEQVGPDHPTSSWFGPRPASFWARRAAHETAVHRWDAQATVTSPEAFPADHAVDIVDEMFEVFVPRRLERHPWPDPPVTIHLHATDTEGEWTVALGGTDISVERAHGKGDVALRGPASDLALVMFGRIPVSRLEVFGDAAVIHRWHSSVHL